MIRPELMPFLERWGQAWAAVPNPTPQQRRATIEKLAVEIRDPLPADVASEEIRMAPETRNVRAVVYRRKGAATAPCLIYLHGGGFAQGSPETHADITAQLASQTGFTVISVDYSLAPEKPFPHAVRDCEAAVAWAFDRAAELAIRPEAIFVGGDSSGGNLAAVMTLQFRGTQRQLAGQLLIYPVVDFDVRRPSYTENANGPIITTAGVPGTLAAYCPNPAERRSPLVAPFLAADHSHLPAAFVAIAEHDPLRDEGRAYAERLKASGVAVQLDEGPGLFHGYLRAMPYSPFIRATLARAGDWLSAQVATR